MLEQYIQWFNPPFFPLSTIRSRFKKRNLNTGAPPLSLYFFIKELYQSKRLLSLYNGLGLRFPRAFILAVLDSYCISTLDP